MKRDVRLLIVAAVIVMALLLVVSAVGAASASRSSDSTWARIPAAFDEGQLGPQGPLLPSRFNPRPPETWPGPSPD